MQHHWITEKLGICTGLTTADALTDDKDFTRVIHIGDSPIQNLHVHPECLYNFFPITHQQGWIRKPVRHGLMLLIRGIGTKLLINSDTMHLSANIAYVILRGFGIDRETVLLMTHRVLPNFTEPEGIERLLSLFGLTLGQRRQGRPGRFRDDFVHPHEYKFRMDVAKSLICQRKTRAKAIQTLASQFKVELWKARNYYDKAKKQLAEEHAKYKNMSPEEIRAQAMCEALQFWEDIVSGDYPLEQRMKAQDKLELLRDINPSWRTKAEKEQNSQIPNVVFYIPENNRLSKKIERLADRSVVVEGHTVPTDERPSNGQG